MKNFIFLILFFTSATPGLYAQSKKMYFFKENGISVKKKDSADYYRTIDKPTKENTLYTIDEYFMDGTLKSKGYSRETDPVKYEGNFTSYFKNGKKRSVATYDDGFQVSATNYFPNGNLYREVVYQKNAIPGIRSIQVQTVKDSTGKALVTNGEGVAVFYTDDFKEVSETGDIRNGVYDGPWTGVFDKNIKFKEVYNNGYLVSGENTDDKNVTVTYNELVKPPSYKGGLDALYSYIGKNTKYPHKAFQQNVQGTVSLKFAVEKDGRITEMTALSNPDDELTQEAKRVVTSVRKMEPGLYRGRPAKLDFSLPVTFNIGK